MGFYRRRACIRDNTVLHSRQIHNVRLCHCREVVGVLSGLTAPGCLLKYHSHLPSKWVLIPRHSKARLKEVTFIDTDPFHVSEYYVSKN